MEKKSVCRAECALSVAVSARPSVHWRSDETELFRRVGCALCHLFDVRTEQIQGVENIYLVLLLLINHIRNFLFNFFLLLIVIVFLFDYFEKFFSISICLPLLVKHF